MPHPRAERWTYGELPQGLVDLIREHKQCTRFRALAHRGRGGYRAAGLEVECPETPRAPAEEIAAMLLEQVRGHATESGSVQYRCDALTDDGEDTYGSVTVRIAPESGEADDASTDEATAAPAGLRWAESVHKRYLQLLDRLDKVTELVGTCMEAMVGALASAAEARASVAGAELDDRDAQRSHEKAMRVLEYLLSQQQQQRPPDAATDTPGVTAWWASLSDARRAALEAMMPAEGRSMWQRALGLPRGDERLAAWLAVGQSEWARAIVEVLSPSERAGLGAALRAELRA